MDKIKQFEKTLESKDVPIFNVGDTVVVSAKIVEEGKTRLQDFEGIVIKKKGSGIRSTFTVRRISYGEGVERTFQTYSPNIHGVVVKRKGKTRRAKLYFLRKKIGKKVKVGERIEKTNANATEKNALLREQGP